MTGFEIRKLQAALFLMDFTADGNLNADGEAGEYTAQAVTAYLESKKLELSDDAAENMEAAYDKMVNEDAYVDMSDEEADVKTFQCALIMHVGGDVPDLIADGIAGPEQAKATELALRRLYVADKGFYFTD